MDVFSVKNHNKRNRHLNSPNDSACSFKGILQTTNWPSQFEHHQIATVVGATSVANEHSAWLDN
jgi:hypothetical protein